MTDPPPKPPGPAGDWCPACGLYWNVRGCTPEKCNDRSPPNEQRNRIYVATAADARRAELERQRLAPAVPVEAPFIASRGELGAPPPDEYPPPWKWGTAEVQRRFLFDGDGRIIVNGHVPSPRVREMVEVAPEMADELRWLVANSVPTWDERGARRDRWVALLARIDAAGKAGR